MSLAETDRLVFEVSMTPHRSLSKRGAVYVTAIIAVFTGLFCLRFWLIGAWPVMLFSLLDVPLMSVMLALNFRRARQSECLMLSGHTLTIIQTDVRGRPKRQVIPTAWLRVSLRLESGASRIVLSARETDYEVGTFLHEPARLEVYEALRDALYKARHPTFDNPQLRES